MGAIASFAGGAGGGGGLSASSSASTGPQKSGDIGGSSFNFGGINTGTQSSMPAWVFPVAGVLIGIGAIAYFLRKR